jgi:hypothetical protein
MTTGQKLVQLSGLATATAMAHLLAITAGGGAGGTGAAGPVTVNAAQMATASGTSLGQVTAGNSASVSTAQGAEVRASFGVSV